MVDAVRIRRRLGRIAERLGAMARFRNLLVHVYADVDDARVHRFLVDDLVDLDEFARDVLVLIPEQEG